MQYGRCSAGLLRRTVTTPEPTVPEIEMTEPAPEEKEPVEQEKPKTNMLPTILAIIVLAGGGGSFAY